jgi:hypothetical protein
LEKTSVDPVPRWKSASAAVAAILLRTEFSPWSDLIAVHARIFTLSRQRFGGMLGDACCDEQLSP